ncbi:hypothetical protein GCM10011591_15000 [Nocardia camponoti]|uniref:Uncharacterized protein n=1 Tax=Nocardia camponoti TaxID=1616106 RepID=A0A917V5X6_9NOCA|nr:hypothetical protein GCM10011591_15000 [Nocardia camponoti]
MYSRSQCAKFRNSTGRRPDSPVVIQLRLNRKENGGTLMIPIIIDAGSASFNVLVDTINAALHGIASTLWTGSFGG